MSNDKLNALKKFFPSAEAINEGGVMCALLRGLRIDTAGGTVEANALLFPQEHSGYKTRLFLDRQIPASSARNWNPFTLGGRTWYACSWQDVGAELGWAEMLASHLRAFR